ncbi:glucose-6-phosphate exchanger slc37a2 [Plakobranchus ocellatus]|uniref:Glucose-6-phosphate exchanger slc37a2 n=1 Tax=Plakobranchus ocellatus TaxID=259542 RepID=A0AAV4DR00_9GAST|nr:glucose-6-phosphate exchanger slc37a2 [Plakobranchus ocellatus]
MTAAPFLISVLPNCFGYRRRDFTYRWFILVFTFFCYASYHLSRKPISVVKSVLHQNCSKVHHDNSTNTSNPFWCDWAPFDDGDYKALFGTLDLCYLVAYAVAMFLSGHIADRMNLRIYLSLGMILSGIFTIAFGLGYFYNIHHFYYYIAVQIIGGAFQASGWPGVVACVGNWFGKGKRGLIMGVWNAHTSVGNILGSVIAGAFVETNWGLSFVVPGIIIASLGILVFLFLVPHPKDVDCMLPDHSDATDRSTNKEDEDEGSPVDDVGDEIDDERDIDFDVEEGEGDGLSLDSYDDDESECRSRSIPSPTAEISDQKADDGSSDTSSPGSINSDQNGAVHHQDLQPDDQTIQNCVDSGISQGIQHLMQGNSGAERKVNIVSRNIDTEADTEEENMVKRGESTALIPNRRHVPHTEKAISIFKAFTIPGVLEFAFCLFFAKLVSYTFLYWLPNYIKTEAKVSPEVAAYTSTIFDAGGIIGGIIAGYVSDKYRMRGVTCVAFLILAAPLMYVYNQFGSEVPFWANCLLLAVCGMAVNGPYALITTAVSADLGTHKTVRDSAKALGMVTAIIDGTGSIGAALGPLLTGLITSNSSWENVFYMLIAADIMAAVLLVRVVVREIREKLTGPEDDITIIVPKHRKSNEYDEI